MINGEIMGTVAIVLIVIGIICVIISIILGITDNKNRLILLHMYQIMIRQSKCHRYQRL